MFKRKQIDMVNGPILKNMIIFAIPVMLASLIQIVFNALNAIVHSIYQALSGVWRLCFTNRYLNSLYLRAEGRLAVYCIPIG